MNFWIVKYVRTYKIQFSKRPHMGAYKKSSINSDTQQYVSGNNMKIRKNYTPKHILSYLVDHRFMETVRPKKYYFLDTDENLHTHEKAKIKCGNSYELFSLFFIENEIPTENVKRGSTVTNRTVERFNLHSWYFYQSKRIFMLYKTIESFFRI